MILATLLLSFGSVTVELPAKVEASGLNLRLGDIAQVTGEDAAEVERVRDLDLGYVPAPGYSRLLYRARLVQLVKPKLPGVDITFAGSTKCRVSPRTRLVTVAELQGQARKVVEAKFKGTDVEISLSGGLRDISAPSGKKGVEVIARPAKGPAEQGVQGVAVDILVDGELWRTQWTTWSVAAWEDIPVLRVRVSKGQKVTPDMFQLERRKRAHGGSSSPLNFRKLQNAVAARDLAPGDPVYARDVTRETVITAGHRVQVEVHSGRVSATTAGVAKQDGRIGDSVRVLLDSSGRELTGTVVAKNRIRVELR